MTESETFMLNVSQSVPGLSDVLREHEAEYDEILPHVLMGDVSRIALRLAEEAEDGSASADAALMQLMQELERGLQVGGESVQELIVVSFLENLDEEDPRFPDLEKRFGAQLRWEWSRLGEV